MAKLTSQQASARAKKGWQKRKRAKVEYKAMNRKDKRVVRKARKKVRRHRVYKAGAAYYAGSRVADHRTATKYQHTWTRANGEKVNLKGFSPHDMKVMQEVANKHDRLLRDNISLGQDLTIRRSRSKMRGAYGGYALSMNDLVEGANKAAGREMFDANKRSHRTLLRTISGVGGSGDETNIRISHRVFRDHDTAGGIITHEMGHAIDGTHKFTKKSGTYRRATGFKARGEQLTGNAAYKASKDGSVHTPKYKGPRGSYGGGSASEHFAESMRDRMGYEPKASFADHRTGLKAEKFLDGKVFRRDGAPRTANITENKGMHQHYDKFLIGGAVVGVAGYGGYKYHKHKMATDKAYKRNVDRRKAQALPGRLGR